ncbi:MAG: hypothetical protein QMD85_00425, partial [Candidatus Aenigmarchaeota archaeon]|nr:hypothetical protein [Candidatus Aenigmarchaeota archaeon]MDI6721984.1 hypothetical protein [Candidatus Aenigmarchaeota archaeon]
TGYKIKASGLHKFFRINGFEIEETEAQDLKVGDYITHAAKIETKGNVQKLPEIKIDDFVTISKNGVEIIKNSISRLDLTRKEFCSQMNFEPRHFRRILNQQYAIG